MLEFLGEKWKNGEGRVLAKWRGRVLVKIGVELMNFERKAVSRKGKHKRICRECQENL